MTMTEAINAGLIRVDQSAEMCEDAILVDYFLYECHNIIRAGLVRVYSRVPFTDYVEERLIGDDLRLYYVIDRNLRCDGWTLKVKPEPGLDLSNFDDDAKVDCRVEVDDGDPKDDYVIATLTFDGAFFCYLEQPVLDMANVTSLLFLGSSVDRLREECVMRVKDHATLDELSMALIVEDRLCGN
jgi:hypothetical protein